MPCRAPLLGPRRADRRNFLRIGTPSRSLSFLYIGTPRAYVFARWFLSKLFRRLLAALTRLVGLAIGARWMSGKRPLVRCAHALARSDVPAGAARVAWCASGGSDPDVGSGVRLPPGGPMCRRVTAGGGWCCCPLEGYKLVLVCQPAARICRRARSVA